MLLFKKKITEIEPVQDGQRIIDLWYCPNCGRKTDGKSWEKCAVCGKKTCPECNYDRGVLVLTHNAPYAYPRKQHFLCKEHYQYAQKAYHKFFKLLNPNIELIL